MVTRLKKFKKEMEGPKELYTSELLDFARRYDALGEMTVREFPDIDTQEYIFEFEKVNGASQKELDEIFIEISDHMDEFSKINCSEKFNMFSCIGCGFGD